MDLERVQMIVSGRVQGVGFRFFTREVASCLGVTGWVRNRPDGSVELEAQGTTEQLAELRSTLEEGPPLSRVTRLVVNAREVQPGERGFGVKR